MTCRSICLIIIVMLVGCRRNSPVKELADIPDQTIVDVGYVKPGQIAVALPLKNRGTKAFRVKAVKPSCSCVQIDNVVGQIVGTGTAITINAKLRLGNSKGQYRENVSVETNDIEHPVLSILVMAWILPPEKVICSPSNIVFKIEPDQKRAETEAFFLGKSEDLLSMHIDSQNKQLKLKLDPGVSPFENYSGVYKRKAYFAFYNNNDMRGHDASGAISVNGVPAASYMVTCPMGQDTPPFAPLFFGKVSQSGDGQADIYNLAIDILSVKVDEPKDVVSAQVEKMGSSEHVLIHVGTNGPVGKLIEGMMTIRYRKTSGKEYSTPVPFSCFIP